MAVIVNKGFNKEARYDDGTRVDVLADGHLFVFKATKEVVAVFAPGQWIKAEVEESA